MERPINRLGGESSPYLLQHRENPVDWYPWIPEAFERARSEDKPILLSIGYSSCHWCHVMAHESFEDDDTAAVMNDRFVSIKVDREERPDIDGIYMEAVQALTGRGGWPMTVFLTPDGKPFYGGTYFPKEARGGLPSFLELLDAVSDAWINQRDELTARSGALTEAIAAGSRLRTGGAVAAPGGAVAAPGGPVAAPGGPVAAPGGPVAAPGGPVAAPGGPVAAPGLSEVALQSAEALRSWMQRAWDPGWGGFGHAPKFPQSAVVEMALREVARSGAAGEPKAAHASSASLSEESDESLAIAVTSLAGMAAGGIYDHLGGGFARYSTDQHWLVPHFEKMLYDQAALLRTYLHGWQVTGDAKWLQVVEETAGYVLRDLALPGGGIASAEDADSEGEEGRFYVWRAKEVKEALPEEMADALMDWYRVTWKGNASGNLEDGDGINILHRSPGAALERPAVVEEARQLLFQHRQSRVRPGLDSKVLTEWNAMFLSSLAEAAAATGISSWRDYAVSLGDFLAASLRRPGDGRWMRSWGPGIGSTAAGRPLHNQAGDSASTGGRAPHPGFAADYAWVTDAFTRLGELTGEARWTNLAVEAADGLLELFWDEDEGGFFTTGADAQALVVRQKESFDGSTPSANSASACALWRLGNLVGNDRYVESAHSTLLLLAGRMESHPAGNAHAIAVADLVARGATEIVVTGERPDLVGLVQRAYLPSAVLAWGEPFPSPLWEGRETTATKGRAYVCEGYACKSPADDPAELARQLGIAP